MNALGLPLALGTTYGSVMMMILAVTILQLVIRFMRVATSELLGDVSPAFKNVHIGTIVASILAAVLVVTGWWQYLWVLFGGANQLMASLALLLVTLWLMSKGKNYQWAFWPFVFMFVTTIAALLWNAYSALLVKLPQAATLAPKAGQTVAQFVVANVLIGAVALVLIVAAVILAIDGLTALFRSRAGAPASAPQPQ